MALLIPTDKKLFFTRNDPQDLRLGDLAQAFEGSEPPKLWPPESDYLICGYPDDEGIALNGGRPGARLAPDEVRRFFYKLTPDLVSTSPARILDLGNINVADMTLEARHELGRRLSFDALQQGKRWVGVGGGHDYGYCEATAFLTHYQHDRPVVINFDAHLDVRPADRGLSSGTPFHRLLTEFKEVDFSFLEVGIQSFCNSKNHLNWLLSFPQSRILFMEDLRQKGLLAELERHCEKLKDRPCLLSVDIDAFTSSEAMGCSQSWAGGIEAKEFFPALAYVIGQLNVRALGLYEISPPLDQDHRTAKLGALIVEHFIRYQNRKDQLA